jgi:hypothetical protein
MTPEGSLLKRGAMHRRQYQELLRASGEQEGVIRTGEKEDLTVFVETRVIAGS